MGRMPVCVMDSEEDLNPKPLEEQSKAGLEMSAVRGEGGVELPSLQCDSSWGSLAMGLPV